MDKMKEMIDKWFGRCRGYKDKFERKLIHMGKKNKVIRSLYDHRRYLAAIVLFFILVIILFSCTNRTKQNRLDPNDLEHIEFTFSEGFEVAEDDPLVDLIKNYYKSYVDGDLDSLEKYATPITDDEKSFIIAMGQYFEEYQNIKVYAKEGIDKGSYFVSAYYEMKFYGVNTTAPGLDFFYVRTDKNGKLYIDNLYSNYNSSFVELDMDVIVYAVKQKYQELDEVIALKENVTKAYDEVIATDTALYSVLKVTIPNVITQWRIALEEQKKEQATQEEAQTESMTQEQSETESVTETEKVPETEKPVESEKPSESETPSETEKPSESESESEKPKATKVEITGSNLNVRSSPDSTIDNIIAGVTRGEVFEKLGTAEGGWVIIDYYGETAYVSEKYVKDIE